MIHKLLAERLKTIKDNLFTQVEPHVDTQSTLSAPGTASSLAQSQGDSWSQGYSPGERCQMAMSTPAHFSMQGVNDSRPGGRSLEQWSPQTERATNAGALWGDREAHRSLECHVTLADPSHDDCPLIGCSDGFQSLTGYSKDEMLGRNARFLNAGLHMEAGVRAELREAVRCCRSFVGQMMNR